MSESPTQASLSEIGKALAKAQKEIHSAGKEGINPHFKSRYATLSSVWEACREALTKNGLAVAQAILTQHDGRYVLQTMLIHESGQFIESFCPLILQKNDMQGLGSAITYARRYALAAIVGVSQDDDDGNATRGVKNENQRPQAQTQVPSNKTMVKSSPSESKNKKPESINQAQLTRLHTIASTAGYSKEESKEIILQWGYTSSKDILLKDYDAIINALSEKKSV